MCCGFIFDEIVCLVKLAFPTMLFNTLEIMLLVTDMMMLGSVGKEALAVGALGNAFYNMIWFFNEGVMTAQDNLSAHAFGSRDHEGIRQWMYVSLIVMIPLVVIGSIIMVFSPLIVEDLFRLHGDMISKTSLYVILLIPALWFQALFRICQKYLLAQHMLKPSVYCIIAGCCINIFFNYLFIFAIDGGSTGCAISTSISRGCMVVVLGFYMKSTTEYSEMFDEAKDGFIRYYERHKSEIIILNEKIGNNEKISGEIIPSRREESDSSDLEMTNSNSTHNNDIDDNEDTDTLLESNRPRDKRSATGFTNLYQTKKNALLYISLGLPGGLVLIVELWTFDIATIIVSQIGNVSVASQSILILYTMVFFVMIPLALSIASSVRISQLLASRNSTAAKVSARICIFLAVTLCGTMSYTFYSLRNLVGYVFTSDADVINRCSQLAGIFAILQFAHGIQGTSQGIFRGMSRQKELFGFTFFAYWLFGLPLGIYLTFFTRPRFGLYGLWCGFTTGLGLLSAMLTVIILFTDWDREVRRTQLRIEKYNQLATPWAWTGDSERIDTRGRLSYLTQASAIPGSRALGGFAILDSRTEEDELDDYERIEISLVEQSSNEGNASIDNSRRGIEINDNDQL